MSWTDSRQNVRAIIFGAIGMGSHSSNANQGKIGLVLGIIALVIQFVVDIILTIFIFLVRIGHFYQFVNIYHEKRTATPMCTILCYNLLQNHHS